MQDQSKKVGGISVETAHIFPIIKKWLYSEKDIFLREIVSNAADAITKLKRLSSLGEYENENESYFIKVILDKGSKTLTVSDNGIGMTEEELEKYICSIALSGALDFIQKYDDQNSSNGIIGHFGLGFYSSFMISDNVELITKSYTSKTATHWICDGTGSYEISACERDAHGTDVIMHISEEEAEYLDDLKIQGILDKYCSFIAVPIYFESITDDESEKENEGVKEQKAPINETAPIWLKNASECTEQEYFDFYKKVFRDYKEPLFYIHINADYPLNFKGVLYFPARKNDYDSYEGQIKLFYNQVFVADDIKEVIPEFLLMLKGVLDCPELPLNVSRSYLQDNAYVKKVAAHIVKKVADKICSLCNNDREKYKSIWQELKIFFEYAALRDKKFYDRVKNSYLLELTNGEYMTVAEYLEDCREKHENVVYYSNDPTIQARYISMFEFEGYKVVKLSHQLDTQYISMYEDMEGSVKFKRIDSELSSLLRTGDITEENTAITDIFKQVSKNDSLDIKFEALKDSKTPCLLTLSEEAGRVEDMMKMYAGMGLDIGERTPEYTLIVNTNSSIIKKLSDLAVNSPDKAHLLAKEIYKLALMSQRHMTAEELKDFLNDSFDLLEFI